VRTYIVDQSLEFLHCGDEGNLKYSVRVAGMSKSLIFATSYTAVASFS